MSMLLSSVEKNLFRSVDIDPGLVGPVLSTGSQNKVRWLSDGERERGKVVKTRIEDVGGKLRERICSKFTYQTLERARTEYDECVEFFGKFVLPTDFRVSKNNESFVMVQEAVDFEEITFDILLQCRDIRDQFEEVLNCNGSMIRHKKKWLDVAGMNLKKIWRLYTKGIPYSENVVIRKDTAKPILQIIDTGTYPLNQAFGTAYRIQKRNARKFGLDFEGKQEKA